MKRKLFGMTGVLAALLLVFGLILTGCNAPIDNGTNSLFTVTFNSNGGSTVAAQSVASGGKATEPTGVTKAGNTLEGWYKEAALTNKWNFASDTVTANITLYAKWTQNAAGTFTVTFNSNGGSTVAAQTVTSGGKVTEPSGVAKTGFTLDGWYKEEAFTTRWNFASDTVTANITLYAKWTQNAAGTFTVTFNSNGGSTVTAQTVTSGGKATEPTGMAKTGFTLDGWYKEEAFTTRWNFASDTVTANIILYAKWTQNAAGTFTVTFNADGGTPAPAAQTVTSGGKVTEPSGVVKTGFTLDGWYKEEAFTTRWNFASDTVTANITLYAKWTQNAAVTFTVTFNADSGTPAPAVQTVTSGNTATEPANVTKTGCTLDGWYKEEAFTTRWNFASDTVTANITLYAKWTANSYIVTYDKNAADAAGTTANGSATYGQNFTLADNGYSRTGYTFGGWYDNSECDGTAITAVNPWNIAANKTYYAKWTANTYTVEFSGNNPNTIGSMSNQTFTYGAPQSLTTNSYTFTGYTFVGWATTSDTDSSVVYTDGQIVSNLTATAGDTVTLYAKWDHTPGKLMSNGLGSIDINFRYVPSGKFQRDSTAANVTVITQGYWLGETEVTQELFQAVMGTNPSSFTSDAAAEETQGKRPVERVSWYDAIAFCNKLSVADGKDPVYSVSGISDWSTFAYNSIPTSTDSTWNAVTPDLSKNGYRLPTEMEWMWAAMGADKTAQPNTTGYNKAFAGDGSNSIGDYAWYGDNSSSKTHEAGKKTANELNLSDMSGNVWEWVWDRYDSYSAGELTDPPGPASGANRVLRGGSWSDVASGCMVASRFSLAPDFRHGAVGFRVLAAAQ